MNATDTERYAAAAESLRARNRALAETLGRMPAAYVQTFGCQQNEADSERLSGMLADMGYSIAASPEGADLILVNTCAIREHAEQKALSTVGQYKHLKAKNPGMLIGVCGCMMAEEHRREDIKHRYPYVDFVFGPSSLWRLPLLIAEKLERGRRLFCAEEPTAPIPEGLPVRRESDYRAWVSVMYGCNNFCSYCIVPYVRGRERSRAPEPIIREVEALVAAGYRDITLLGQNVNSYGKDLGGGCDFADLLARIDAIPGDYTLRFMTSHPKDAGRKLIDVMASATHVAHHFHLPMQSGSDRVLSRMNRHYDTAAYLETVAYLRERIPDVTITSDIIVGFPGESEADFEGTLEMLERVRFDMLYSFLYSPRKGTPAAEWEPVSEEAKKARFARLLETQNRIGLEKNQALVGRALRVLCDGPSQGNPALLAGRTDGGKIAFFPGDPGLVGSFVTVLPERADPYALYGKLIGKL